MRICNEMGKGYREVGQPSALSPQPSALSSATMRETLSLLCTINKNRKRASISVRS